MPTDPLRPAQHQQLHVLLRTSWILLFANPNGVKGKILTNFVSEEGSREKLKLQQLKERQLHSRNSSCSPSTGNKPGTLGEMCLFQTAHQLCFFSQDLRKLLLASKKTLQGYFKGRQEL